jgi:predicted RNA-binding protein with PUA-like domain
MAASSKRWLMKAEPDSRIVKGKDVKARSWCCSSCGCAYGAVLVQRRRLRADEDHTMGRVSIVKDTWTSLKMALRVRNHQAKNFLKEMQLGDNILFVLRSNVHPVYLS